MVCVVFFFFNDTATTEIYTLSLHDALPILVDPAAGAGGFEALTETLCENAWGLLQEIEREGGILESLTRGALQARDRKSTRLNSSHANISYAVFCLKKKK